MDPLQLFGLVLDLTDAVLGMVALVSVWYTWVLPAKKDPRPTSPHLSEPAEIDRFLERARGGTGAGADHVREEDKQVHGALPWSRER